MEDELQSESAAIKSTGPTTPEGKARSSRNAEKHGMYGSAVLLHYESAEDFTALRAGYFLQFAPTARAESGLADRMIAATWRLRRLIALESAALDHTIDAQRAGMDSTYDNLDPEPRAHFAFDKLAPRAPLWLPTAASSQPNSASTTAPSTISVYCGTSKPKKIKK